MRNNLKIFACGVLAGSIVLVSGIHHFGYNIENKNNHVDLPKLDEGFKNTKVVEEYTFDYNGTDVTIRGNNVKVYSFDDDGSIKVEDGNKVEIPVDNYDYLLDTYVSENETMLFNQLKEKDNYAIINDEYDVYTVFSLSNKVFTEYMKRDNFDGLQERKDAIFNACDEFVNDKTMFGEYNFSNLSMISKKGILSLYEDISYMYNNNEIIDKSSLEKFIDSQKNVLQYTLFKAGKK